MHYHRHSRRKRSPRRLLVLLLLVALAYVGILLGVRVLGNRFEQSDAGETLGSLDGRFDTADVTLEYGGRTWTYRGRSLTNLLLIGEDRNDEDGSSSRRYAGQADFLYLITFDRKNRSISALQIDRDSITPIRIYGPFGDFTGVQEMQICLAHAYGETDGDNCENTVWAVSHMLGDIPIDGYLALDMQSISLLNDALGGVTVTLEEDFSSFDPQMTQGTTLTLRGEQALCYVRGRMSVGDGTNAGRMRRQQTFIAEAQKLLVQGLQSDPGYADVLFDALDGHLMTDKKRSWLVDKAYECRDYTRTQTQTLAGEHVVGDDGYMEFYPDQDALNDYLTMNYFE